MYELGVYNSWAWEQAFGKLPRWRKRHQTIEEARAEAERLIRRIGNRGDGRGMVVIIRGRNVVLAIEMI